MLEQDDISTEEVLMIRWKPIIFPKLDLCKCGGPSGDGDVCPYSQDVLGEEDELCNCCDICRDNCSQAI